MSVTLDNLSEIRDQGLHEVLLFLEDRISAYDDWGDANAAELPQVCINCWSLWEDGTCTCQRPHFWPISHAIGKLRSRLDV